MFSAPNLAVFNSAVTSLCLDTFMKHIINIYPKPHLDIWFANDNCPSGEEELIIFYNKLSIHIWENGNIIFYLRFCRATDAARDLRVRIFSIRILQIYYLILTGCDYDIVDMIHSHKDKEQRNISAILTHARSLLNESRRKFLALSPFAEEYVNKSKINTSIKDLILLKRVDFYLDAQSFQMETLIKWYKSSRTHRQPSVPCELPGAADVLTIATSNKVN